MKIKFLFALAAISLIFSACENEMQTQMAVSDSGGGAGLEIDLSETKLEQLPAAAMYAAAPPAPDQKEPPRFKQQKLIKDGDIDIKSSNLGESKKQLDELLKQHQAYYETERFDNDEHQLSYRLKIRIPSASFSRFINGIDNGGDEITRKNINTRDVTEEYVDLESRLVNKKLYLKRYREILSKAAAVKDMMAIEETIRNLQEELESAEGRLRYLRDQVAYSSISLFLFTDKPYVHKAQKEINFTEKLKTAFDKGWRSVTSVFIWFVKQWPWVILITGIGVMMYRKRKNKPIND